MKKVLALLVSVVVLFIFLGLFPVHGEADIYDNVIRLHVVANSDSEEDQLLKLKVRDAVLGVVTDIEKEYECGNIEEAKRVIESHMDKIVCAAEKCISKEGYYYDVEVLLGKENYPTKNYEACAFPSGKYLSLQVKIGEARGENWWCVLFPPLCLSAASEAVGNAHDALINVGFTGEQYKIITESDNVTYNVRFKILETFEEVFS